VDSLEIDYTNSYCPIGCCRKVYVDPDIIDGLKHGCLRILGLRGQAEETDLIDEWSLDRLDEPTYEDLKLQCGLELNPEKDPWEYLQTDS
jgi:hypothetical protein